MRSSVALVVARIGLAGFFCLLGSLPGLAAGDERADQRVELVDDRGRVVFITGLEVSVGDRFIAEDNREYEVVRVEGGEARVRFIRQIDLSAELAKALGVDPPALGAGLLGALERFAASSMVPLAEAQEAGGDAVNDASGAVDGNRHIAVYHTHSDESYKPTSGKTNEPWNGDIFKVGTTMAERLRQFGLTVTHSPARHDPHDGQAYMRSRRTVTELLKANPDALFDVHRDTPPPEVYATEIEGKDATKVLIVVGRQNPNMHVNEKLAWALKDYADKSVPGSVRGIFYARGHYNQDLFPRALLLEVGSTFNRLEEAQTGARFFSDVIPAVLYGITQPQEPPAGDTARTLATQQNRSGWWTAVVLLLVAAGGVAGYLLLNEGSWSGAVERLREWAEHVRGWTGRVRAGAGWRGRDDEEP